MKRLSSAVALALLATATGAHAQSGPVNHKDASGVVVAQPSEEADMAAPPPPPAPDLESQIAQVQQSIQSDLDQHKISHHKAVHLQRKLKVIGDHVERLDSDVARIAAKVP